MTHHHYKSGAVTITAIPHHHSHTPSHTRAEVAQERAQKTATLGSGARFKALERSIAKRGGVRNPAAVAAAIGRKKYGKAKFQRLAARGK